MDLIEALDERGVVTLTLDRPHRRNALDHALIADITATLRRLDVDSSVRIIVLRGAGGNFCAGADIEWMRRLRQATPQEREDDADALAEMFHVLDSCSKPTVALVEGAVYGGGAGLVACCDIALADRNAIFSLSEVRLGLAPAVIGPYLIRAIGAHAARALVLSGDVISAERAQQIGLVHRCVGTESLTAEYDRVIESLLKGAPGAQSLAKNLLQLYSERPLDAGLRKETAKILAERWASSEGAAGVEAFLQKRAPPWRPRGRA